MDPLTLSILGSSAISTIGSLFGSKTSASTQQNMFNQGAAQQQNMFNQGVNTQRGYVDQASNALNPFIQGGASALPTLTQLLTPGADMSAVLSQIPGFKFAQQYGQKAITNQATSRGLSGNALTAGADYATGSANQTYGTVLDALLKQAGLGGNAAGTLAGVEGSAGNAALAGATGVGNAALTAATGVGSNVGNTQASGILGGTNALAGGANAYGNLSLLDRLMKGSGSGASTSGVFGNPPPIQYPNAPFSGGAPQLQ